MSVSSPPLQSVNASSRSPQRERIVLWILVVATVLMPVSYRAGLEDAHPHTILQGVVDAFLGVAHQHHQGEDAHGDHPSIGRHAPIAGHTDEVAATGTPDVPTALGLSMPISAASGILVLALLVATILAGDVSRATWSAVRTLTGRLPAVESPPPQIAA